MCNEEEAKERQALNLQKNNSSKSEIFHFSEIKEKGRSSEKAAQILNTNYSYISKAKKIKEIKPELIED